MQSHEFSQPGGHREKLVEQQVPSKCPLRKKVIVNERGEGSDRGVGRKGGGEDDRL